MSRKPYFAELEDLSENQLDLLMESKTFCMLPWMHMHAFPDGRAYPCCLSDYWHPVGDSTQKHNGRSLEPRRLQNNAYKHAGRQRV